MEVVQLDAIKTGDRIRELDQGKVQSLADSMDLLGLLNPIILDAEYKIITGLHRFEAAKLLGWDTINATFKGLDKAINQLAEIDENLIRNELSKIEIGEHLKKRDEILEQLGLRATVGVGKGDTVTPLQTTEEIAEKAGIGVRTSQRLKSAAKGLTEEAKEVIKEEGLEDATTVLVKVSKLPEEEQIEAIREEKRKRSKKVRPQTQGVKNGGKDQHNTPRNIVDKAVDFLGEIDLDPASNLGTPNVPAKHHFTIEDDALVQTWMGAKLWMNPPFSDALAFVKKWVEHFTQGMGQEGIILLKLDSRTKWFALAMQYADAVGMHKGYMQFGGETDPAPFPVGYFYFGPRALEWCDEWSDVAWCFPTDLEQLQDDAIARDVFSVETVPAQKVTRLSTGQEIQVCRSFKPEAREAQGLPLDGQIGIVRQVLDLTVEVEWEDHDPTFQVVEHKYICSARQCGGRHFGDRKSEAGFKVGDRVAFTQRPEKEGEIVKVMATTCRVKFDDPNFGMQSKSMRRVKTENEMIYTVQTKMLEPC